MRIKKIHFKLLFFVYTNTLYIQCVNKFKKTIFTCLGFSTNFVTFSFKNVCLIFSERCASLYIEATHFSQKRSCLMQRRSLTYKKETRSVISYRIAPSYFNCPPLAFFLQKANGIVYIGKSFVFQCR